MDRTAQISSRYQVISTPTTFFIAPDGTIADAMPGTMNQGWLERNLDKFLTP